MASATRGCRRWASGLFLVLLGVQPAFGQTPALARGTRLDLTAEVVEAYDDDIVAQLAGVNPLQPRQSGLYTMFNPQLGIHFTEGTLLVAVTAGSSGRYYRDSVGLMSTGSFVGAGFSKGGRRTSVTFNQGVTYAPSYFQGLFANSKAAEVGEAVSPGFDYAQTRQGSYAYQTTANVTRALTPRASVALNGGFGATTTPGNTAQQSDMRWLDAGSRLLYSLNRNIKMRLGYNHRNAEYSPVMRLTEQGLDVGIDYSRALSQTRRTNVGFALAPKAWSQLTAQGSDRRYGLSGDAGVTHQLGRTWTAGGAVHRGLEFVQNLAEPVVTNGVTATASGALSRRTNLSLLVAGSFGASYGGAPFRTATADLGVRHDLGGGMAATVSYLFYLSDFDKSFVLPSGVSSRLTRNGVRVGLMLRAPVRR